MLSALNALVVSVALATCASAVIGSCSKESLAVYEVQFETFWHRKDFPKHYPEWRPPASWSKLLGFSHDTSFEVFRKGEVASAGLKIFAERADCSLFDLHTQGSSGVHDIFSIPPIGTGVGSGKTQMTVDGNHSSISMVSKIMPSPDWFIGVDSYDLCPKGRWLEYAHIEVGPLDAGTDKGLTFTSPNWPSNPQEKIHSITAHYPSHPAGSFYYPDIDELPVLAQFTITKKREYSLQEKFEAADHSMSNLISISEDTKDLYRYDVQTNDINYANPNIKMSDSTDDVELKNQIDFVPKERRRQFPHRRFGTNKSKSNLLTNHVNPKKYNSRKLYAGVLRSRTTETPKSIKVTEPGAHKKDQTLPASNALTPQMETKPLPVTPINSAKEEGTKMNPNLSISRKKGSKRIPSGDVMAVIDDIVKDYQKERRRMIKKRRREERRKRREKMRRIKPPRDCRVSDWLEWSPCSKTCGIGEQTRHRKIVKHARRGGKPCPILQETTWCGSARACPRDYFNWQ